MSFILHQHRGSAVALACLWVCAASAQAQVRPDAGQTLRETQPAATARPLPAQAPITVQSPADPTGSGAGIPITPTSLSYTGNTVLTAAQLDAIVQDGMGKPQTLGQLNQLVGRITAAYRAMGYPFARAYLPPQDIKDGKVTVAIVEGRYGKTQLTNTSAIKNSVIEARLAPMASGQIISEAALQRQILLLQELPGIQPNAVLVPGTQVGTADLRVQINPGTAMRGTVDIDNQGSRYTGRPRVGAGLAVNNPAGLGDTLTLRGITSGKGLTYVRAGYQLPVGGQGLVVGGSLSAIHYKLGDAFTALDANGKANTVGLNVSYPLVRSAQHSMNASLGYEHKTSQDRLDALLDVTDKTNNIMAATLAGDLRDASGSTGYTLAYSSGKLSIDPLHAATDALTARTAGSFHKLNLGLQRLQTLSASTDLWVSYSVQKAGKNLDSVEKMSIGGPGGVRAYPTSEAAGDSAQLLSIELRHTLSPTWQVIGFVDAANSSINKNLWAGALAPGASNTRSLSGAGVAVQWDGPKGSRIKAQLASRIGSEPITVDKNSRTHLWLNASFAF